MRVEIQPTNEARMIQAPSEIMAQAINRWAHEPSVSTSSRFIAKMRRVRRTVHKPDVEARKRHGWSIVGWRVMWRGGTDEHLGERAAFCKDYGCEFFFEDVCYDLADVEEQLDHARSIYASRIVIVRIWQRRRPWSPEEDSVLRRCAESLETEDWEQEAWHQLKYRRRQGSISLRVRRLRLDAERAARRSAVAPIDGAGVVCG